MKSGLTLSFSDVVQLVRKEYSNEKHDIGYAEGATIVDRAIEPQVNQALIKELESLEEFNKAIGAGLPWEIGTGRYIEGRKIALKGNSNE